MPLQLFNTLSRKLETFTPIKEGEVGFYGCGPTVYNYAHIGNLRAYITHDILVRTLRSLSYKVTHVMNVTDVGHLSGDNDHGDDKMVKTAEERGQSVLQIADFYTKAFFNDTERLNINRPTIVCKATEHIPQMISLIQRMESGGYTYSAGGNLYFDISKFPTYGELARLKLDELKAGARTDIDGNKRNAGDFVLWFTKSKFENQALTWDSPWGRGYPGWHVECSAMSIKYLGEQFDIHAGGIDHIQIHHTNEIAQSESATGKRPWVRYWVHNEFLVMDKGKMSKSHGSFVTLQNIIDMGFDPLDLRYLMLGAHYRSQLQFSNDALQSAANSRKSLVNTLKNLNEKLKSQGGGVQPAADHSSLLQDFNASLADDLNTPRSLSSLWTLLKNDSLKPEDILAAAFKMDEVLGLSLAESLQQKAAPEVDSALAAQIEEQIALRAAAKKAKDFAKADTIRNQLKENGIILEDSQSGTIWHKA